MGTKYIFVDGMNREVQTHDSCPAIQHCTNVIQDTCGPLTLAANCAYRKVAHLMNVFIKTGCEA